MALSQLSRSQQDLLWGFLNTGALGPVYVACPQEDILATLGEPDHINIQYFGPIQDDTLEILARGRTDNIRIDTFSDSEHDLLLEHYTYGKLQITLKDRCVSHFTLIYHLHDAGWPPALATGWLDFLGTLTHHDLRSLFVALRLDQHVYYYEGYETEGPMLIRADQNFDIDFAIGAEGPADKITVSAHRERGLPLIQISAD